MLFSAFASSAAPGRRTSASATAIVGAATKSGRERPRPRPRRRQKGDAITTQRSMFARVAGFVVVVVPALLLPLLVSLAVSPASSFSPATLGAADSFRQRRSRRGQTRRRPGLDRHRPPAMSSLGSDSNDGSNEKDEPENSPPSSPSSFGKEEGGSGDAEIREGSTLLCMYLSPIFDTPIDRAVQAVQKYCQSFPFAAVLPVQPLTYRTTPDGHVQLRFLRKKTSDKPGTDGGINFYVRQVEKPPEEEEEDDDDEEEEIDVPVGAAEQQQPSLLIEVKAKRNEYGQSITKMMAEKIIVTNFVNGLTGESSASSSPESEQPSTDSSSPGLTIKESVRDALLETVQVTSLYHKWMDIKFNQ